MTPNSPNNTGYDWTVRTTRPDADAEQHYRCIVARSPDGRVEIEADMETGQFYNPREGTHEDGQHYVVSVYTSTHYDYDPRSDTGEFIDHDLSAHIRPGQSGQGWAASYTTALTLVMNGVIAVEKDAKWIREPMGTDPREFVSPALDRDAAIEKFTDLFDPIEIEEAGEVDESYLREQAVEAGEPALAEYLFSLTDDDLGWLVTDAIRGTRPA